MKKVTGIGGFFIKSNNPKEMLQWYNKHLGFVPAEHGTYSVFEWKDKDSGKTGQTLWTLFGEKSTYFQPSNKDFMFNFRVENLEELLKQLKEEGIEIVGEMQVYDYGKFAHIMDPEGNKIELWEPIGE